MSSHCLLTSKDGVPLDEQFDRWFVGKRITQIEINGEVEHPVIAIQVSDGHLLVLRLHNDDSMCSFEKVSQ